MKMSFGKRFLFFIHWLLSLAVVVAFLGGKIYRPIGTWINTEIAQIPGNIRMPIFIAAAAIYVIIALWVLIILFSRIGTKGDRGFIVTESSDKGRVRVAISAIEQMVRQAIRTVDGVNDMKISIANREDSIIINVNSIINSGVHVPTVTTNMQNAIRRFVEMNCGVAVRAVEISVQSVSEAEERGRKGRKSTAAPMEQPVPPIVSMEEPVPSVETPIPVGEPESRPIPFSYGSEKTGEPTLVLEEEPVSAPEE